jgi:5-methylcytosine-specific restriction enzyme A
LPLPPTDREKIIFALEDFDAHWRPTPEWEGWQLSKSQRYALAFEGRQYPPKKIISLATGIPVSEFSGGKEANEYLARYGFEVVDLQRTLLPQFEIGRSYARLADINEPFGGSWQSGISASSKTPAIFLFTGETGEQYGYHDDFDSDGVFTYTGEGQIGDMAFVRGNAAIRDHAKHGRALHLFRSSKGSGRQEYMGEFTYANHTLRTGPDREGHARQVIAFHLVPVNSGVEPDSTDEDDAFDDKEEASNLKLARARALSAFAGIEGDGGKSALRTLYRRSAAVQRYVLMRANGICESCRKPAPFARKDGTPYLEPHHTTRVSDGGLDHPRFVAAICPSCHREIHHGIDGDDRNYALVEHLRAIESAT